MGLVDPIDAPTRHAREKGRLTKKNAQVQDAMGEAARVANERIDTANRGKKMLDDGGPDVELKLRCKRQCRKTCLLYTSPSPRDATLSRMPSSA